MKRSPVSLLLRNLTTRWGDVFAAVSARLSLSENEGNYFKTWHWFYRFVMAGRTVAGYRQRMWHMARIRLRDIMQTPWSAAAGVPAVPAGTGGGTGYP